MKSKIIYLVRDIYNHIYSVSNSILISLSISPYLKHLGKFFEHATRYVNLIGVSVSFTDRYRLEQNNYKYDGEFKLLALSSFF